MGGEPLRNLRAMVKCQSASGLISVFNYRMLLTLSCIPMVFRIADKPYIDGFAQRFRPRNIPPMPQVDSCEVTSLDSSHLHERSLLHPQSKTVWKAAVLGIRISFLELGHAGSHSGPRAMQLFE